MIQQYINSGILEAYVTGSASDEEVKELLHMKASYPEVNVALQELEKDMELIAKQMAISPPAHTWDRISDTIDELILRKTSDPEQYAEHGDSDHKTFNKPDSGPQYIEVEAQSNHMRVHKTWKWVFIAVFVLSKVFLAGAIYFYLENRQAQQQLNDLKIELKQIKR